MPCFESVEVPTIESYHGVELNDWCLAGCYDPCQIAIGNSSGTGPALDCDINLLLNTGAEDGSADLAGQHPFWNGTPTISWMQKSAAPPTTPLDGRYFNSPSALMSTELYQIIDASAAAEQIDASEVCFEISGYLNADVDTAQIKVDFLDVSSVLLGSYIGTPRTNTGGWVQESGQMIAPIGTRLIKFRLLSIYFSNAHTPTDASFDNLSLVYSCVTCDGSGGGDSACCAEDDSDTPVPLVSTGVATLANADGCDSFTNAGPVNGDVDLIYVGTDGWPICGGPNVFQGNKLWASINDAYFMRVICPDGATEQTIQFWWFACNLNNTIGNIVIWGGTAPLGSCCYDDVVLSFETEAIAGIAGCMDISSTVTLSGFSNCDGDSQSACSTCCDDADLGSKVMECELTVGIADCEIISDSPWNGSRIFNIDNGDELAWHPDVFVFNGHVHSEECKFVFDNGTEALVVAVECIDNDPGQLTLYGYYYNSTDGYLAYSGLVEFDSTPCVINNPNNGNVTTLTCIACSGFTRPDCCGEAISGSLFCNVT